MDYSMSGPSSVIDNTMQQGVETLDFEFFAEPRKSENKPTLAIDPWAHQVGSEAGENQQHYSGITNSAETTDSALTPQHDLQSIFSKHGAQIGQHQHTYSDVSSLTFSETSPSTESTHSSFRHKPYTFPPMPAPQSSSIGPIRSRRGAHHIRNLSYGSGSSDDASEVASLSSKFLQDDDKEHMLALDENGDSVKEREIKMGDHALKIPLKSPSIAPQLQSSMRMTSTGKPSHARKVPEGHVKRPRNAFILFRSYACTSDLLPATMGIKDHRQVSRVVGQIWKGLRPEEKAIWEKKAAEEKEAHRLANPNYRYRPTYRRDDVVKRRRKKQIDEDEVEEEERKCEVVARVLLEGKEVDGAELEKEIEEQKQKDQEEGRKRTPAASRSRSRSKASTDSNTRKNALRPNSAPPNEHPFLDSETDSPVQPSEELFLAPAAATRAGRTRAVTMPSQAPDVLLPPSSTSATLLQIPQQDSINPGAYFGDQHNELFTDLSSQLSSPPVAASTSQQAQTYSLPEQQASYNFTAPSPFKNGLDALTLLSPSFSRKFSLGRWEVPQHAPTGYHSHSTDVPVSSYLNGFDSTTHGYVYDSQPQNATVPQPASAYPPKTPTYVYLSKEEAENPQIVEHYLNQGFGVSFDA